MLTFYAELIWKKCRDFFVKRRRRTTVETGALSIIENRDIDGQMGRVWRAGLRHDPFNSAWANPARATCDAWAVASARSAG
jgi:hypothetical protein